MNPIDYWYKKYIELKECERIPKPELTWKDVRKLSNIIDNMMDIEPNEHPEWIQEEGFYTEVLRRFNEAKQKQK